VVSNQDAIEHFAKTGEHLGLFSSEQSANNYAVSLHESQASQYTDDANGLLLNGTQDDNYNPSPPVDATRVARTNIPPAKMSQVVVAIK
jgi:hypothetical protein